LLNAIVFSPALGFNGGTTGKPALDLVHDALDIDAWRRLTMVSTGVWMLGAD
jgi:hypothetical protein